MNCAQMIAKTIMIATATAHSFTFETGSGGTAGGGAEAAASTAGASAGGAVASVGSSFGGSEGIHAALRAFADMSRFAE
jgi:hypothetical protein